MPRKLSPEEAAVMIIRRRLQQMEEAKMAHPESTARRSETETQQDTLLREDKKTAKR